MGSISKNSTSHGVHSKPISLAIKDYRRQRQQKKFMGIRIKGSTEIKNELAISESL
jgi:hypothetical protein